MFNFRTSSVLIIIIVAIFCIVKLPLKLGLDLQGGMYITLEAQDTPEVTIDDETILGTISVIRNRIDSLGLTEPIIRKKGHKQITIELPGIKSPERALALIGETALLEFIEAEWAPPNTTELTKKQIEILAGKNAKLSIVIERDKDRNIIKETPIILKRTLLTGKDLKTAFPGTNEYGQPIVHIEFTPEGGKKFYEITQKNTGKPLAISLDKVIISAPNIQEAIAGGKAQISGSFSIQEMKDLVIKLKAGALPVPVEIISNKIVGPSLGLDSINKSKNAFLIGLSLVIILMILSYRIPGIIASTTLILYLIIALAIFKLLNATLTLPGIAGFILTMGMAVDANIIIFERIKEEYDPQTHPKISINTGFKNAFSTILDANITTLIAAIVLFWLGTGTIKGFAISLSIGILTSMFSAIIITRLLLDHLVGWAHQKNITIFKGSNND
jgi:preprotein translocase subunit SecD